LTIRENPGWNHCKRSWEPSLRQSGEKGVRKIREFRKFALSKSSDIILRQDSINYPAKKGFRKRNLSEPASLASKGREGDWSSLHFRGRRGQPLQDAGGASEPAVTFKGNLSGSKHARPWGLFLAKGKGTHSLDSGRREQNLRLEPVRRNLQTRFLVSREEQGK